MLPGFFLDIVDNTGDGFSYEILPVKDIRDVSLRRIPVTLVRSVVRSRNIASLTIPTCRVSPIGFQFYNRDGIELFGTEEVEASHAQPPSSIPINPDLSQVMNSSQVMGDIDETYIDEPLSLSNILYREEPVTCTTILPTSEDSPQSTCLSGID
jgi:hypothetical protein